MLLFRLLVVFIDSIVAPLPARVYMCVHVGWYPCGSVFVCPRARGVWVSCGRMWGLGGGVLGALWARDRVGAPLVGVWVVSRERFGCLCEVCGWVWDVECVAFDQELFCL